MKNKIALLLATLSFTALAYAGIYVTADGMAVGSPIHEQALLAMAESEAMNSLSAQCGGSVSYTSCSTSTSPIGEQIICRASCSGYCN